MSIAQNLKLLNKPIAELAMLPQETIMQMAQMGQIPVAYVAPILEVKAEQAQTGAEIAAMAAQEQMPLGTEIERIIAQNAANEAKAAMPAMPPMAQQMPMQMPEDSGIAALPVDESIVPEYAGGGIVAFKTGDLVDEFDYEAATRGIDTASGRMPSYSGIYSGLSGDAAAIKAAREEFLGANQSVADLLAYNEAAEKRAEARARQQTGARILQAGLLGLSGDSPYFGVNLGKMAPAVEGYMGDVEKQEAAKEARSKAAIAAKAAARAEDEKSFTQALQELQARNRLSAEQSFRAGESALDRKNRLAIANLPPDVVRGARAIMMPGEKLEDALSRFANITSTKDQYNAAAGLVKSAYDAASKRFADSIGGSGGNFSLAQAAGGIKEAQKRLGMTKEQAEKELTRIREEYLKEAYRDIGMNPETANRYLRAPRGDAPRGGAARDGAGQVDLSNPLLRGR